MLMGTEILHIINQEQRAEGMLWRSSFNSTVARVADFLTAYAGYAISFAIWGELYRAYPAIVHEPVVLRLHYYVIIAVFSLIWVSLFEAQKAYSYQRFTSLSEEYGIVAKTGVLALLLNTVITFMLGYDEQLRRTFFIVSFLVITIGFLIEKTFMFYVAAQFRKRTRNRKRVLLIGTGTRAKKFIDTVANNFSWGLDIVGLLTADREKVGQEFYGIRVVDVVSNIESVLREINPEEIIVTISTKRFDQIRTVFETCEREGVQIRLNSDFFGEITKKVRVDNVYGINIISFDMVKASLFQLFLKRIVDILGALVGLVVFSPFMFIAGVGILITDGRPILYAWNVMGLNKKPIRSWKFRTMVRNADELKGSLENRNEMDGPVFKIANDPRITSFGRWLRKFSIDETPQLLSVLKGDLSLVGPRPAGPKELVRYESWHRRKLSIKPGITCLWQINGRNKINSFDEWVKLDLEYIDNWSLWLDLKILVKTIPAVLMGKGAS